MTPQEIDRIENAIRHIQTAVDVDPWAVEIAVKAMEKQVPKKPIKRFDPHDNDDNDLYALDCPTCKRVVGFGNSRIGTNKIGAMSPDMCGYCGQAIDWSEEG